MIARFLAESDLRLMYKDSQNALEMLRNLFLTPLLHVSKDVKIQ